MNSNRFNCVILLSGLALFACAGSTGGGKYPSTGFGVLTLNERYFDFGKVVEGDVVRHSFKFINTGEGVFRITKTETSCGCTTAKGALKTYFPGEKGELEVTLDTKGKHGAVMKTVNIHIENSHENVVEITLSAELTPPPHPVVENGTVTTKEPKCKSCHLESGVGQEGIFLYHRVCVQCHGRKGVGASARALNDAGWLGTVNDDDIKKIVRDGMPEKGMPPYVSGVSPALNEKQVHSLVEYIRKLPGN